MVVESPFARFYYRRHKSNHSILLVFSLDRRTHIFNRTIWFRGSLAICVCVCLCTSVCAIFILLMTSRSFVRFSPISHMHSTIYSMYVNSVFLAKWFRIEYELLLYFSLYVLVPSSGSSNSSRKIYIHKKHRLVLD